MGDDFSLKWNDHHSVFFSSAEELCRGDLLTDVTLSCGPVNFSAHKLVLSVCSSYFAGLFSRKNSRFRSEHAIVYLKDIDARHMELLLSYMYRGEINVEESELVGLLATAKGLQIKGLTESNEESASTYRDTSSGSSSKRKDSSNSQDRNGASNVKRIKQESILNPLIEVIETESELPRLRESAFQSSVDNSDSFPAQDEDSEDYIGEDNSQHNNPLNFSSQLTPRNAKRLSQSPSAAPTTPSGFSSVPPPFGLSSTPGLMSGGSDSGEIHTCNFCYRQFKYHMRLIEHLRTHTKEKPFTCKICGKNFTQKGSCSRHERSCIPIAK